MSVNITDINEILSNFIEIILVYTSFIEIIGEENFERLISDIFFEHIILAAYNQHLYKLDPQSNYLESDDANFNQITKKLHFCANKDSKTQGYPYFLAIHQEFYQSRDTKDIQIILKSESGVDSAISLDKELIMPGTIKVRCFFK